MATRLQRLLLSVKNAAEQDATTKMKAANDTAAAAKTEAAAAKTEATSAATTAAAASSMATAVPSRVRNPRIPIPALSAGLGKDIVVVWQPAFPSANYTLTRPLILGTNITLDVAVSTPTATGCTVTVKNVSLTNLLTGTATLHLTAIHDPL